MLAVGTQPKVAAKIPRPAQFVSRLLARSEGLEPPTLGSEV